MPGEKVKSVLSQATPIDLVHWSLRIKLSRFGLNTFPNNARMNNSTDLNLGDVVCTSIILLTFLLNGYDLISDGGTLL